MTIGTGSNSDGGLLASRMMDLRAQVEAQVRALARAEEQLAKRRIGKEGGAALNAFRQCIQQMSSNNAAIHDVLNQIAEDAPPAAADPV